MFALIICAQAPAQNHKQDTLYAHDLSIEELDVKIRVPKQHYELQRQPISSSVAGMSLLSRERVHSVKDLSVLLR